MLTFNKRIEIIGYIDDININKSDQLFEGKRILNSDELLKKLNERGHVAFVLAFGHCSRRIEIGEMLTEKGFEVLNVIHPQAIIAPDVLIEAGAVILAGAIIDPGCIINQYTIVNNGAIISHNCIVGKGTHICPGVNIAGKTTIGEGCWIGIGSTIINNITIGDHVFLGAGSLVTNDLPSGYLAYGNPAKIIHKMDKEF